MTKIEAEKRIAQILEQFEIDTGTVVESLSIEQTEVTGLHRLPGHNWAI